MPADRQSLNRAFWDLGLRFQWDEQVWTTLMGMPDLRAQLCQDAFLGNRGRSGEFYIDCFNDRRALRRGLLRVTGHNRN